MDPSGHLCTRLRVPDPTTISPSSGDHLPVAPVAGVSLGDVPSPTGLGVRECRYPVALHPFADRCSGYTEHLRDDVRRVLGVEGPKSLCVDQDRVRWTNSLCRSNRTTKRAVAMRTLDRIRTGHCANPPGAVGSPGNVGLAAASGFGSCCIAIANAAASACACCAANCAVSAAFCWM